MSTTSILANHIHNVYFGGNWTESCLKDHMSDLSWEEAKTQVHDLNTILTLVYHMNYYVNRVGIFLETGLFDSTDDEAFNHPQINSQHDWEQMLNGVWKDAERFESLVKSLPDEKLQQVFIEKKYGTYYENILGIIEHFHYHLGQIVLIKKIIRNRDQ